MKAVAAYTKKEAERYTECPSSYYLPQDKVEGGVVCAKRILSTNDREECILVVPAGVRILPHNHPDVDGKKVTETYETLTIENGMQKTVREDCFVGGTHEFICEPNKTDPKKCYSIVTAIKYFSAT